MTGAVGSVVVVGASVAGVHTAEQLRARGFGGRVVVVGAEPHLPYDRPPLSKQMLLGTAGPDQIRLRAEEDLRGLGIELRLGIEAIGVDETGVLLADGSRLDADRVVVATGVTPRRIAGQPDSPAVGMLRTLDDSLWLADRLARSRSIAIIGGGFIGAEVASAARERGLEVSVLEAFDLPMQRVVGSDAAQLFAQLWREHGVRFIGGAAVRSVRADGDGVVVQLGDDPTDELRVDTVVVGIGSTPNAAWLGEEFAGSGLVCDGDGRVVGHPRLYAVGDVAAWPDVATGESIRIEHWTSARSQAAAVAAHIVGPPESADAMPEYFWTDQFGVKVQVVGRPDLAERTVVVQSDPSRVQRSAVVYSAAGRVVAVALFSAARLLGKCNAFVRDGADETTMLEALQEGLQPAQQTAASSA